MRPELAAMWAQLRAVPPQGPPWFTTLLTLAAAVLAAFLVHFIVAGISRRVIGTEESFAAMLLRRSSAVTRLALVVFSSLAAVQVAPLDDAARVTISHVLVAVLVILVGWFCVIAVDLLAEAYLRRFPQVTEDIRARKHMTQVRILRRSAEMLIVVLTAAAALMTFDTVRQYGVSLFASAGVAGIAVGLAARPMLSNLIAGVQIALTQPIRIEDAVTVENEFGWIEEIAAAYVVIRIWDKRRLIVPLSYFIEKPFQNWTRQASELIGTVDLYVDYSASVVLLREKLHEIVSQSPRWDRRIVALQVADLKEWAMQVRALMSARNVETIGDLRTEVREQLITFLQERHPEWLPKHRAEIEIAPSEPARGRGLLSGI
jgi:small-conductance mechanosensitive channel